MVADNNERQVHPLPSTARAERRKSIIFVAFSEEAETGQDQRQAINVMRNMQLQQTALIQGQEEGAEERQEAKGEQTKGSTHSV
jgi:hypothetical protein